MNLHRLRRAWLPCLLSFVIAGCSSTTGSRFGGTPQAKSIAVVGDRPVSVATGEPGGQVVAEADPDPKPNPRGRISGRVIDEQGEPVSNVTVRLADGGTKGGKDVRATTDKTGAFTLNGLRPGSTYSLIAETDDDQGALTGRIKAKTSDRVEIALVNEEAASKDASRRTARPAKARPISNREESTEEPAEENKPTINREDVAPPAESAETLDPGPPSTPPADPGRPQLIPPKSTTGWQNTTTAKPSRPRTEDSEAVAASSETPTRRSRIVTAGDDDDEGPNPLPPAIEPGQNDEPTPKKPTSARLKPSTKPVTRPPVKQPESGEISLAPETSAVEKPDPRQSLAIGVLEPAVAANELPPLSPAGPLVAETPTALLPDLVEIARSEPVQPASLPSTSGPPELPPIGAAVASPSLASAPPGLPPAPSPTTQDVPPTSPASQPVFVSQEPAKPAATPTPANPADYNPFALVAATPTTPTTPTTTSNLKLDRVPVRSMVTPASEPTAVPEDSGLAAPVAAGPKTKWGDLATTDPKPPLKVDPTKATIASSFVKRFRPALTLAIADTSVAVCSYDAKLRKIKDFRLPDLEGKPVRFQDLDSDFVLLDFWGTWCSPCVESIPHLIELQKKYEPSRFQVVGIACEEVPPAQRKAKVEEVSRRMGINYPILLSGMDGKPCPVQQALSVQAMPTMILFNRKGEVIWRSTGATPANELRLDRVLASQIGSSNTVRR
jgi:thiol-disulfide isomerase/thioredoxin